MMRRAFLLLALLVPLAANAATTEELREAEARTNAMRMDVDKLQQRLVESSRSEREVADKLRVLRTDIQKLEKEQGHVSNELKARRQTLADLLVALSRLSRLPPEIGLLRQEKTSDAVLASILLNSSLPAIKADAQRLADALADLDRVQKELENQRTELAAARKTQARERADIEGMLAARKSKLQLSARQQADLNAQLEKLRRESQNVDELIDNVATPKPRPKKGDLPPVLALRGGYLQPVSGSVARTFGDKDDSGIESKGLTFRTEGQERIIAPAAGRVMFAGPFKGYGQIVIIEHDADMHSLVSGFGRIDVRMGQKVARGEPMGLVEGSAATRREVYYELRRRGDPIDPKLKNS